MAVAVVNSKGVRRVRAGHPWVYKSDVVSCDSTTAGAVTVLDERRKLLGTALLSPNSTILLRLVSRVDVSLNREFWLARVHGAYMRRLRYCGDRDAYRVVHGEADLLPGVFVDRYADALVLQTTCGGADAFESTLVSVLQEVVQPKILVVRNDVSARRKEALNQESRIAVGGPGTLVTYHEGHIALTIDLLADQKTGAFLDQSTNHVRAGELAHGRALDCFTYHGGFALQLASRAEHVMAVDQSKLALSRGQENARSAGLTNLEWLAADVLELLPRLVAQNERFDTVVLDPPAFASTAKTLDAALAAYQQVNARALKLLHPNGLFITCSCSGRITAAMFEEMLGAAAADARRSVQILERRGASLDHPVLTDVPETEYLKCLICAVSE